MIIEKRLYEFSITAVKSNPVVGAFFVFSNWNDGVLSIVHLWFEFRARCRVSVVWKIICDFLYTWIERTMSLMVLLGLISYRSEVYLQRTLLYMIYRSSLFGLQDHIIWWKEVQYLFTPAWAMWCFYEWHRLWISGGIHQILNGSCSNFHLALAIFTFPAIARSPGARGMNIKFWKNGNSAASHSFVCSVNGCRVHSWSQCEPYTKVSLTTACLLA